MHYQVPRLRFMVLHKIAVSLWCSNDAVYMFRQFYRLPPRKRKEEFWKKVENTVVRKANNIKSKYTLAENLEYELLDAIKIVGYHIWNMKRYIDEGNYIPTGYPKILCWTPHGTIDTGKSIAVVLKDDLFSIDRRYKLACIYCLEDDVRALWRKTSLCVREFFCKETPNEIVLHNLAIYWSFYINGKLASMRNWIRGSVGKFGLEHAFIQGSKPAAMYFLQKLSAEETDESFAIYFDYFGPKYVRSFTGRSEHYADLIYCLLVRMNEKQQSRVFERYSYIILQFFLEYPFYYLLETVMNNAMGYISDECKELLLDYIEGINRFINPVKGTRKISMWEKIKLRQTKEQLQDFLESNILPVKK
ncbi:uncharacterized protein TNCT_228461 [Trichonephila clavata]|uniref:Uncharacterized protein n=1 Tax=Trichonephila clavata TaxID=2740835 RepID=A0A8X6HDA2_TRICU|nr:uncharacterized protein TNCT_228461 [Trichonephila clavata]